MSFSNYYTTHLEILFSTSILLFGIPSPSRKGTYVMKPTFYCITFPFLRFTVHELQNIFAFKGTVNTLYGLFCHDIANNYSENPC
jgi:hypothetical protein